MGISRVLIFLGHLLVKFLIGLYVLTKSIAYSLSALIASGALLIIALSLSVYLISIGLGLKDSQGFVTFREELVQQHWNRYMEHKIERGLMDVRSPENYSVAEMSNASCSADTDCSTPMDYMIRSNCPYTSKCIENKCAVICPAPFEHPVR